MKRTVLKRLTTTAFAFLSILSPGKLAAQELLFKFDPAQTRIGFTLGDVLHTVHGTFHLKSGFVKFERATGIAQGLIVVDATSGDSGSGARDQRMHKEILESQQYPEITFAPSRVQGQIAAQGESQLKMEGVLTLHGSQHLVILLALVNPAGDLLSAETQFEIPYVQWGLKNPSNFILRVSTTVQIKIQATGTLQQAVDPH